MFGWFKKRTAAPFSGEQCVVDISENGMSINGVKLDVLVHLNAAEKLLGTPRSTKFRTDAENREFLELTHGDGMVSNRVNYTWDDLGIYCYTMNGKVIHCFGFHFRNDPEMSLKHAPARLFRGTLTICGKPWMEAVKSGEDCEFLRELHIGNYLITAEYAEPFVGESPDDGGYNCVEVQLEE